jgi:hypothetical protein
MDSKFAITLGILVLGIILEMVILITADKRRRRALAEAGPSQGFQPIPPGSAPTIALVPVLEHKHHTWGQVLQGARGTQEVLLFDYSYSVGKDGCNQTLAAFRSATASFPKFQLRSNHFLTSAGWGAYQGNRVKFDLDPQFNKSYLLTGPDTQTLSSFFQPDLRHFLVSMPDHSWTIEGYGNWLVFYRHGKKVKPAALFEFVQSAGQVADGIFDLARQGPTSLVRENGETVVPAPAKLGEQGKSGYGVNARLTRVKLKINGREVIGGNIGTAVEDEIFTKAKEQMVSKVEGIRCPEHGQGVQLEFEGDGLSTMKVRIKACCELQRQRAQAALSSSSRPVSS